MIPLGWGKEAASKETSSSIWGSNSGVMGWWSGSSNAGVVPDCRGEERAEPKGKAFNLPNPCMFQTSPVVMKCG